MSEPNATPTANPSGILWSVMASISNTLRCHDVLIPSALLIGRPKCKWGNILSINNKKAPPNKNPIAAGNHAISPFASDISMAGFNRDQKLAAIITPAAKPSIEFNNRLSMVLKKNTIAAPNAVTPHVKSVAKSAKNTGLYLSNHSIFVIH
jgi:hypothetical protein